MAGEQAEALPDDLRQWVTARAEETGQDVDDVLERAVAFYRFVGELDDDSELSPAELQSQLESVAGRLDRLETEFDDKVQDVRQRVVQVKREADSKAPADHDHPELTQEVDSVAAAAEEARESVDEMDARVEKGFENYEDILEYLTDETDELDEKLHRLASTVVSLRQRAGELEAQLTRLDATAEIQEIANRNGDRSADCEDCGRTLDVGLLARARCPHCQAPFVDLTPSGRFFRSAKLLTGDRPALVAGDEETPVETNVTTADLLEADDE